MGGMINVAIRFRDGRTVCQERWTNNIPFWFKHPLMFAGDTDYVQAYINLTRSNEHVDWKNPPELCLTGRPSPVRNSDYGIIVWDFVTNTILDNNVYSDPISMTELEAGSDNFGKMELFNLLAKAGQIHTRQYIRIDSEDDYGSRVEISDPLSFEQARAVADKLFAERRIDKDTGKDGDVIWQDFYINPKPMTYLKFPERSWKPIKDKLIELDFPMTKKAGLNKLIYVDSSYQVEDEE
jgi:hypothetical protein